MANDNGPNWDGLLKWSIAHSDGTQPPRNLSEEDRRWFMEAMQSQSVDVVKRMKEITLVMQTPQQVLKAQGVTVSDLEGILDELQEHVESIDTANDLHSIGGLVPLIGYLKNSHPGIRAKAADVLTTIVQNNPKSQQLVMEANGLEPLLSNFKSDSDVIVRTKALGAISSLIRHNKPGMDAFRLGNGYAALKDALSSASVRFQRKALNLVHYLLEENSLESEIVYELGYPGIMNQLVSSGNLEVREAALRCLLELVQPRRRDRARYHLMQPLKEILQERIDVIRGMSEEDLGAVEEERHLVDSLWKACYGERSSLSEKGEDAPLQPMETEKKAAPLLLGPAPAQ